MGMLMHHTWLTQQEEQKKAEMPVKEAPKPVPAEPVEEPEKAVETAKKPVKRVTRNTGRKRTGK